MTDENGNTLLAVAPRDSLRVLVRRIGYAPFDGFATRASTSEPFAIQLLPTAQRLAAVNIRAKRERTPLENAGFYQRVNEMQRGALNGEFITPEQLEAQSAVKMSQILARTRYARVTSSGGARSRPIIVGRMDCPMTVVVDGIRQVGVFTDPQIRTSFPSMNWWTRVMCERWRYTRA